jgi:hypothetical protein
MSPLDAHHCGSKAHDISVQPAAAQTEAHAVRRDGALTLMHGTHRSGGISVISP